MSNCSTCGGCGKKSSSSNNIDLAGVVKALVQIMEKTSGVDLGHNHRVGELAKWYSAYLGIDSELSEAIGLAGRLHDIGMLGVPNSVLTKVDPLTDDEWLMIEEHPNIGYDYLQDMEGLEEIAKMVSYHHEHFDGKGYPEGLKENNIHLGSRIIAVCETVDTMMTEHPYRDAHSPEEVEAEIQSQSGKQFDPWLCMHVKELIVIWQEMFAK